MKRALTDPTLFDGIGNAYSDEILHAAKLSPFRMTPSITDDEIARAPPRVHRRRSTLWTERLRDEVGDGFPDKVTAFRPEMAVHGKYGQPCPVCGTTGAAHRLRRQRGQLLPDLPDRGPAARRPGAVAPAQGGLAEDARGARGAQGRGRTALGSAPAWDESRRRE